MWASCASDTRDPACTRPAASPLSRFTARRRSGVPTSTLPLAHLPLAQRTTATLPAWLAERMQITAIQQGFQVRPRSDNPAPSSRGAGCRDRGSAWKSDLPPPKHSSSCAARRTRSSTSARLLAWREPRARRCTRVLGCSKGTNKLFHAVSRPLSPNPRFLAAGCHSDDASVNPALASEAFPPRTGTTGRIDVRRISIGGYNKTPALAHTGLLCYRCTMCIRTSSTSAFALPTCVAKRRRNASRAACAPLKNIPTTPF